jgi:hypothetical protein
MSPVDYSTPYDLMAGLWNGISTVYDANGEYLYSTSSLVAIYWTERSALLSFRQLEAPKLRISAESFGLVLPALPGAVFDLQIDGKSCRSTATEGALQSVEGTQISPDTYVIMLTVESNGQVGRYYNNQYFVNPNERRVIGPYFVGGSPSISNTVTQAFTRISYDIPASLQRDIVKP